MMTSYCNRQSNIDPECCFIFRTISKVTCWKDSYSSPENSSPGVTTEEKETQDKTECAHVLAGEMCFFKKLSELIFPLLQLVAFLTSFLLGTFLHVLLKHLLAFLRRQQQIAWVKHDLV